MSSKRLTLQEINRVKQLVNARVPRAAIARQMGCTEGTIDRWCNHLNIKPYVHQGPNGPQVAKIFRLAERGVSLRKIAAMTGFARDTVRRVLRGERREKEDLLKVRAPRLNRPAQRCSSCGRLVHMPCLACQVERAIA